MKSFRSTAAFGAAALVILTSGAAFAGTPLAPSSGAHARPAASARAHHRVRHARTHRAVTPAKKK